MSGKGVLPARCPCQRGSLQSAVGSSFRVSSVGSTSTGAGKLI